MKLKVKESIFSFSNHCNLDLNSCYFILETSNSEQTETSMDNTVEITGLPSACHQSTQIEDVLDLTKEPAKEDVSEEQGSTLPSHSQNETEV